MNFWYFFNCTANGKIDNFKKIESFMGPTGQLLFPPSDIAVPNILLDAGDNFEMTHESGSLVASQV